jgi:hypothetical protein
VTRTDAVLSVRAGFRERSNSRRCGQGTAGWRLQEQASGAFSHCFRATRSSATVMRSTRDARSSGAGPAGSTAAIILARAGWSVALVEKESFPRRKVCGECLAAGNLPLLDALGVGEAFDRGGGTCRCAGSR